MAGNSSTASSERFSRSWGMFRASFQMHLRTSSAILASFASGGVPREGKGFTSVRRRANNELEHDQTRVRHRHGNAYRKTDIRRAVENMRRMIMLMNRDRSLTWLFGLSSVSSKRRVNSCSRDVMTSTVKDSARNT
jgi:hypothetical protein